MTKLNYNHIFLVLIALFVSCSGGEKQKTESATKAKIPTTVSSNEISVALNSTVRNNGSITKVQEYLKQGADVNFKDQYKRTALMFASYNGSEQIAEELLKHHAAINLTDVNGRSALMFAASGPFPETVKLLLENGADVNIQDKEEHFSALMYAASEGQLGNIKVLLEYGANADLTDIDGDSALDFAQANGHTQVVEYLKNL